MSLRLSFWVHTIFHGSPSEDEWRVGENVHMLFYVSNFRHCKEINFQMCTSIGSCMIDTWAALVCILMIWHGVTRLGPILNLTSKTKVLQLPSHYDHSRHFCLSEELKKLLFEATNFIVEVAVVGRPILGLSCRVWKGERRILFLHSRQS